ncbi:MAG: NAD(P)/FAD-dependent oxidoreductase [Spirochaetes bacterium]|nr:NAD(P)/FAD-dependent oxidoreductase [Spirochaetota bacterium]
MKFECTIIGAGVVGLAVARRLSEEIRDDGWLLVVESERTFGRGISSRNSEVIHSGIYYPRGSFKHILCARGRRLLYEYCAVAGVPYRKCGKIIVATRPAEVPALDRLERQAADNGIENVCRLDAAGSRALEPEMRVHSSLLVKEAGIVDSHSLLKALEREVRMNNGTLLYNARVAAIRRKNGYEIELSDGTKFMSSRVINAAGLSGQSIAAMAGIPAPELYPCKGTYFSCSRRVARDHLIYPVPEQGLVGLGIHATIDLAGRVRFGPDVEYIDGTDDFSVDEGRRDSFYNSIQRIFPEIKRESLLPDMAGIRPKLQGPHDREVKDFYIGEERDKGFPGFINLLGIESPGLTACLAIGEYVGELIDSAG